MGNRKVNIMPMAGEGTRFKKKGFTIPKPLIDIHGKPMFIRSANSMPDADLWIFICQKKIFDDELILHHIKKNFINYEFICLDKLTDGQARTCSLAKEFLLDNDQLFISACDNYIVFNIDEYFSKIKEYDILVFTTHCNKLHIQNINSFGWIKSNNLCVEKISCKKQLSEDPTKDKIIIGTFAFRSFLIFENTLKDFFQKSVA